MKRLSVWIENTPDVKDKATNWLVNTLLLCGLEDQFWDYEIVEISRVFGNKVHVTFECNPKKEE